MTITIREQVLAALRNNPGLNNAKLQGAPAELQEYRKAAQPISDQSTGNENAAAK
ncbi:hypothetical protein [Lelliottia sp. WAP21]|uniref:hypothetical protein n=1 Tax=Lelliottia sp. WAP21 TaxID=2877426 RepID=UPI001E33D982|nr:hypothetical protein [Lelliottia sp. WAP21]